MSTLGPMCLSSEQERLLNAAPQMLEALKDAKEKLRSALHVSNAYVVADRTVGETNWRPLRDRMGEALAVCIAAIKAAEGEVP